MAIRSFRLTTILFTCTCFLFGFFLKCFFRGHLNRFQKKKLIFRAKFLIFNWLPKLPKTSEYFTRNFDVVQCLKNCFHKGQSGCYQKFYFKI